MFDLGFWEISLIIVIGLLVLGPERLPRAARTFGLWVGKARRTLAEVKRDIDRELDAAELKEITKVKDELQDTTKILQETARDLNTNVESDLMSDMKQTETKSPSAAANQTAEKEKSTVNESKVAT